MDLGDNVYQELFDTAVDTGLTNLAMDLLNKKRKRICVRIEHLNTALNKGHMDIFSLIFGRAKISPVDVERYAQIALDNNNLRLLSIIMSKWQSLDLESLLVRCKNNIPAAVIILAAMPSEQ